MKKILFVCSGNTCRSPMAEGYFNYLVDQNGLKDKWSAVSAGLHAFEGSPAHERSHVVSSRDHIDLSKHRSQPLSRELAAEAFLILTMTREHKEEMIERFPESKNKTHVLKEFAGQKGDIADPIGLGEQIYESTYREIKEMARLVLEKLKVLGPGPINDR